MKSSLNQQTFNAAGPSLILKVLTQSIQLFVGILSVRLLSPDDYGLWGIIMAFWTISLIFVSGGFGGALQQKKEITQVELSSVFYYNLALGFACCFSIIFLSGYIAQFFNQPDLREMLHVIAWAIPISAVGSIHHTILYHRLRQHVSNYCVFLGYIAGIPVVLYLAWKGYGAWSLVWQMMAASTVSTVTVFFAVRWFPDRMFSFAVLRKMFKFGSSLLVAEVLNNVFDNIYNIIIGKFYPLTTLGYFDRAKLYAAVWPQSIQWTIGSVLFPAFSKIQEDAPRLKNAFLASLQVSVFIIFFPSILLAALAYPFIGLVLSDKWLPIVVYFQILSINFILFPLLHINYQILNARGKSGTYLYLEIINKILIAVNIGLTVWFGVVYMVIGMVVVSAVSLVINTRYTNREIGCSLWDQTKLSLPYLIYSGVASGIAWGLYRALSPISPWVSLIVPGIVGCLIYAGLNWYYQSYAFVTVWTMGWKQVGGWFQREKNVEK